MPISASRFNALRTITQAAKDGITEEFESWLDGAIDELVPNKPLAEGLKFLVASSREYYAYCIEQQKKPSDPAVAVGFLFRKGRNVLSLVNAMSDSEMLEIADAVAELAISLPDNIKMARGGPYGALLGFGMILNDAMNVVYSIRAVQSWYYETFLKECDVTPQKLAVAVPPRS